jgi:hypothetical protein
VPCGPSGACRMRLGRPVHIQGAIEQAEAGHAAADQVCMARDVAIMFDELRAIADRLPSCTPTGAAPGGCGPADHRAGPGAAAVHNFGNVASVCRGAGADPGG